MKVEQKKWTKENGWEIVSSGNLFTSAQLVLIFGARAVLMDFKLIEDIKIMYPNAHLLGCSTAGEICGIQVLDNSLVVTAIEFEHTTIKGGKINLEPSQSSYQAGEALAKLLDPSELCHVFVISNGLGVNGSDLVSGLTKNLPNNVTVTGGLAADSDRFIETVAFWDCMPDNSSIAILGFYGDHIKIGFGSMGGWDPFGPERLITRSEENILFELDGQSALELYKKYLGEHADGLPATGLLFPLSLRTKPDGQGVVRTVLAINEKDQSMTFAGALPEGAYVRFMKANFDRLIDGAIEAARACNTSSDQFTPHVAILISCVGRKLVLKQRVEEEIEGVRDILGNQTVLTGFYSYGEISPFKFGNRCELHNQTMTITTLSEE
ncbi:MAG: FIST C-terminal domain-containing protein [Bacteroidota bacterium]|nr:FIST C-terminal domain-containing protein [Bacteroidota bacterium]